MISNKRFAIIGGDLRNIKLAEFLSEDECDVKIYGFENVEIKNQDIMTVGTLEDALCSTDVVIGPVPCSLDDHTLNCTYFNKNIFINELFRLMDKDQIFIAGRISEKIIHLAESCSVYWYDILEREEMSVLNAIPTAEGAIQIAMEELHITLHDSNTLVLGYGRIGKILAKMLQGIGANVYVEARKYHDIAWIESYGYKPIHLNNIYNNLNKFDVIFNTIPYIVLDTPELEKVRKDCVLID